MTESIDISNVPTILDNVPKDAIATVAGLQRIDTAQLGGGGGGPVNASDVNVNPAVGGNTDAQSVLKDHEARIVQNTGDIAQNAADIAANAAAIGALAPASVDRLLASNVAIAGGETRAVADPFGLSGWYFQNIDGVSVPGRKINYFTFAAEGAYNDPSGINIDIDKVTSVWADISTYEAGSVFIHLYTKPQGPGDAQPWYRTRYTYEINGNNMPTPPDPAQPPSPANPTPRRIIWALGIAADKYPLVKKLELVDASSVGPAAPDEKFMFMVISTSTGNAPGVVEFTAHRAGMVIGGAGVEAEYVVDNNGSVNLPLISSGSSAAASESVPFSYFITATNGPTAFGMIDAPAWLSVNALTGEISGVPPVGASLNSPYVFRIWASNSAGVSPYFTLSLSVTP